MCTHLICVCRQTKPIKISGRGGKTLCMCLRKLCGTSLESFYNSPILMKFITDTENNRILKTVEYYITIKLNCWVHVCVFNLWLLQSKPIKIADSWGKRLSVCVCVLSVPHPRSFFFFSFLIVMKFVRICRNSIEENIKIENRRKLDNSEIKSFPISSFSNL